MLIIEKVAKGSIGQELGLKKGDIIKKFNKHEAKDILDYLFFDGQDYFSMTAICNGREVVFEIDKYNDESLGLTFDENLKIKRCQNKCIFCFVDQLPKGMRKTLYCKDDDYRHSFFFGNYITLTNLAKADFQRIKAYHISPLYVSIHAIDDKLRSFLLGRGSKITKALDFFCENNITIHGQIVLCEGINDGENLKRTLDYLSNFENLESLSVVPVGLTKYRQKLFELQPISEDCAKKTIQIVEKFHEKNALSVFCSDEFYLKAKLPTKSYEYYENFCQIENGVGLIADFLHKFENEEGEPFASEFDVVTGKSACDLIENCCEKLRKKFGCKIKVHCLENQFFGDTITVSGLLTGQDISRIEPMTDTLLIPSSCVNDNMFLDDLSISDLEKKLNLKIIVTDRLQREIL